MSKQLPLYKGQLNDSAGCAPQETLATTLLSRGLEVRLVVTRKMKSLQGEVQLNITAAKAWKMFTDNEILGKINPGMLSGVEYLEGDGSPGSLRVFKLGPALHHFVKESVQKVEKVETGQCFGYEVIGGELKELYDPYHVTFSFAPVPGKEGEQCVAGWKAEFEPISPATPPPEKAKDAALGFLKLFETCEAAAN